VSVLLHDKVYNAACIHFKLDTTQIAFVHATCSGSKVKVIRTLSAKSWRGHWTYNYMFLMLVSITWVVIVVVTVFKCGVMGPDCSTCQSVQVAPRTSKFGCQWCGDRCQHNSTCDRARLPITSKCPLPVIESVPNSIIIIIIVSSSAAGCSSSSSSSSKLVIVVVNSSSNISICKTHSVKKQI